MTDPSDIHCTRFRNSSLSIFACSRIEINVPAAISVWFGTVNTSSVLVMEKMDMATGLPYRRKPKIGENLYYFTS